jgi:hypothetical protein
MTLVLPEKGEEKASEKPLFTRSLVDPAVAFSKPRPKVVAAPPVATFLLVEVPRHLEDLCEGTETPIPKHLAILIVINTDYSYSPTLRTGFTGGG